MPTKEKNSISKIIIAALIIGAIYCMLFLYLYFVNFSIMSSMNDTLSVKPVRYNSDWTLEEGKVTSNITLPIRMNDYPSESTVISKTLPSSIPSGYALCFRTTRQAVTVKVDSKTIYDFKAIIEPEESNFAYSSWQMIQLKSEYAGKVIRIELISAFGDTYGLIPSMLIGEQNVIYSQIIQENMFAYTFAMLLIMVGVVLLVYALINLNNLHAFPSTPYLAVFMLFTGIYLLCTSKMPQIMLISDYVQEILALISLFVAPAALLMQFRNVKPLTMGTNVILLFHTIAVIIVVIIQFRTSASIFQFMSLVHVYVAVELIYCGVVSLVGNFRRQKLDVARLVGSIGLITAVISEIIFDSLESTYTVGQITSYGIVIYVICELVALGLSVMRNAKLTNALREDLEQSQAQLMLSQIKPHFVYNSLSAIQTMIKVNPNLAYDMVFDFSNYMRANLNSLSNNKKIKFTDELKHIEAYTNLEKVRFGDRIQIVFDVQYEDFYIPPLSVQPLVENAIKHGICKKADGGIVKISTLLSDEKISIIVYDNGVGFDIEESKVKQGSVGIKNIEKRLEFLSDATLEIDSKVGVGTVAKITMPVAKATKEE